MPATVPAIPLEDGPVRVAGAWDGLSAVLARDAGARALFCSGFAVAASLGLPDADLYTREDMTRATGVVARASGLPVVADLDTGWGDATSAWHATRAFEAVGAAAVMLEDQVSPKPGPLADQPSLSLVPLGEAAEKVRACVEGRRSPTTLVVARTNARDDDDVVRRARAYADAGADVVLPMRADEGFGTDGWRRVGEATPGTPLAAALVPGSWLEHTLDPTLARTLGISLLIHSLQGLLTAARAIREAWDEVLAGHAADVSAAATTPGALARTVGLPHVHDLKARYAVDGGA